MMTDFIGLTCLRTPHTEKVVDVEFYSCNYLFSKVTCHSIFTVPRVFLLSPIGEVNNNPFPTKVLKFPPAPPMSFIYEVMTLHLFTKHMSFVKHDLVARLAVICCIVPWGHQRT